MTMPADIQAAVAARQQAAARQNAIHRRWLRLELGTLVEVTGAEAIRGGWQVTRAPGDRVAHLCVRVPLWLGGWLARCVGG